MKEENWGEWAEKYKPIPNHIDKDGTYFALDGVNYSFETYGEELKYIEKQNSKYVWTLIEEDGDQFIQNGKWHVNRLAYFVCKNPCDKEQGNEVFCYWVNDNEDTIVAWLESGDRELIADAKEMAERIYEEKGITKKRYEELIK